jgi:uncharacterized protein (DUF58 family)
MTKLVFRLIYRSYRITSGALYRVRRRLTPAGLMILGALCLVTVLSPDTENNALYQALPLFFCLVLIPIPWTFAFRASFSVERVLPRFGTVGQPLKYRLRLRNRSNRPQSGLALLENLADPRPPFQEWFAGRLLEERRARAFQVSGWRRRPQFRFATIKAAGVPPIAGHGEGEVVMELSPHRRGVLRFEGITLARPDPLGLVRALARTALPQTLLILPKRYRVPPLPLPGTCKYQQGGVALAANVGQSDEFVAIRDYRHGDPLRHIHWRSWARAGKPVVKEFEDEFFVRHALILDTFTEEPHSEVFEEAVAVAASFACTVQTQESLLDLLFVGTESYCFTAGRGVGHADQILEVLASVNPIAGRPFAALEHLVLSHCRVASGCICVWLTWDAARRELVRKLQALGMPVLVLVIAGRGEPENIDPGPMRDDPARFKVLRAGQIEKDLADWTMRQ